MRDDDPVGVADGQAEEEQHDGGQEQAIARRQAEADPLGDAGPALAVRDRSRQPACPIEQRRAARRSGPRGRSGPWPPPGCGRAGRGPGRPSKAASRAGSSARNHRNPRRPQLVGDGVVADDGLVGGGARPRPAGCRTPPTWRGRARRRPPRRCPPARARAVDHPAPAPGQQAVEGRSVPLLGGARQPVRRAHRGAQGEGGGDVLALDGPDRVDQQRLVVGHAQRRRASVAIAGRWVGGEAVVDRHRLDAPVGHLDAGPLVDGTRAARRGRRGAAR